MLRRDFLRLLGGAAVATQIPATLLAAEEKTGDYCVRYIRAYDIFSNRIIERVDVSRGLPLSLPRALDSAEMVSGVSKAYITRAIKTMKLANVPPEAIAALESEYGHLRAGMMVGVDFCRTNQQETYKIQS